MPNHRIPAGLRGPWSGPPACSLVTIASAVAICVTAGPLRVITGLTLLAALAWAVSLLLHRAQFDAIVPVTGLTLVFLVLTGLGLATVHILSVVPTALAVGAAALLAAWAAARFPRAGRPARAPRPGAARPGAQGYLAAAGALVLAVTATLAVRSAAESATADSSQASSLALWAYPVGGELHVGAQQPDGHGAVSLRIVVTQAGVTAATWDNVRLGPDQAWDAPALPLKGSGQVQVTALRAGKVVATLSAGAVSGPQ